MGRRRVQKRIRRLSLRRWGRNNMDMDMEGRMGGTWIYGTRCRLATSAYSFRFSILRWEGTTCWELG
jgi:hypothetical protein